MALALVFKHTIQFQNKKLALILAIFVSYKNQSQTHHQKRKKMTSRQVHFSRWRTLIRTQRQAALIIIAMRKIDRVICGSLTKMSSLENGNLTPELVVDQVGMPALLPLVVAVDFALFMLVTRAIA